MATIALSRRFTFSFSSAAANSCMTVPCTRTQVSPISRQSVVRNVSSAWGRWLPIIAIARRPRSRICPMRWQHESSLPLDECWRSARTESHHRQAFRESAVRVEAERHRMRSMCILLQAGRQTNHCAALCYHDIGQDTTREPEIAGMRMKKVTHVSIRSSRKDAPAPPRCSR